MGSVFEAEDRRDRTRVAVKLLHPHLAEDESFRERFEREAHVAALLRSPYTVHLLDYGRAEEHLFLVMEYVDGPSVAKLIEERQLSPIRAVRIASEVARALEEAEARGVVHRDIKPENILIVGEDNVKVADFGIARRVGGGGVTEVGGFVGSVLYASPEQARGEADRRSDIYALGAVIYAMVAGRPPFAGSPLEVMRQHAEASLPVGPLLDLPDPFVNIIRRCLEKDPQDRYQSASELAGALERVQRYLRTAESTAATPAPVTAAPSPPATVAPPPAPAATVAAPSAPQPTVAAGAAHPPETTTAEPETVPPSTAPPQVDVAATRVADVEPAPEAGTVVSPPAAPPPAIPPADATIVAQERTVAAAGPPPAPDSTVVAPAPLLSRPSAPPLEPAGPAASAPPAVQAPATLSQPSRGGSGRKRLALGAAGLVGVAVIAVVAFFIFRPEEEKEPPGEVSGTELVNLLDDEAPDAFRGFGTTESRLVRPSALAADEDAIDAVEVNTITVGLVAAVEMVVFPSTADARRYLAELLAEAGISGGSGCASGTELPDAPLFAESHTCYDREGEVVILASVLAPAEVSAAEALARRSTEVIRAARNRETVPRATAFVVRGPSSTPGTATTATATAGPSATPTVPPTPTAVPIPISAGVWTYDFGVTSNSCPFGLAAGNRFAAAYLLAEVGAGDGLISPGELVDVTQDGSNFYIGRFTFTFPTFEFTYPVTTAGESGTARVTNTYQDANTGSANLVEVYFLRAGGSCSFLSTE